MAIVAVLMLLAVIYLLAIKGRLCHKDLSELRKWNFAHRGLHADGMPENSLSAFNAAKTAGYGIELDIHLMKDGKLAVIHDASLKRTASTDILIEDLTEDDLKNYHLEETQEKIPLLSDVLDLIHGEVPLIVELKSVGNNYAALCDTACKQLADYQGLYCMESFDPRCILWLRKNKNEIMRGQLAYNLFRVDVKIPAVMKFLLQYNLLNFVTKPDFIAYKFSERKNLSNFLCRKAWGMQSLSWTIRNQEDFDTAQREGWIPIFEGFKP